MYASTLLAALAAFSVRDLSGKPVEIGPQTTLVPWSVDCLGCLEVAPASPDVVYVNTDPVSRLSEVRHAARLLKLDGPVVNDPNQSLPALSVHAQATRPAFAGR